MGAEESGEGENEHLLNREVKENGRSNTMVQEKGLTSAHVFWAFVAFGVVVRLSLVPIPVPESFSFFSVSRTTLR